jgi:integrase
MPDRRYEESPELIERQTRAFPEILRLAIFAGMRPGELLDIQREHVRPDASVIEIRQRVYRGKFATPKNGLFRKIGMNPKSETKG